MEHQTNKLVTNCFILFSTMKFWRTLVVWNRKSCIVLQSFWILGNAARPIENLGNTGAIRNPWKISKVRYPSLQKISSWATLWNRCGNCFFSSAGRWIDVRFQRNLPLSTPVIRSFYFSPQPPPQTETILGHFSFLNRFSRNGEGLWITSAYHFISSDGWKKSIVSPVWLSTVGTLWKW